MLSVGRSLGQAIKFVKDSRQLLKYSTADDCHTKELQVNLKNLSVIADCARKIKILISKSSFAKISDVQTI